MSRCAVGLVLVSSTLFASSAFAQDGPTFSNAVAPIVLAKCAGCHRPGQVAPFSLLSHEDFKKRGDLVAGVIERGSMPPWKAASDLPLDGDRRLTEAERQTFAEWFAAGMPPGDPAATPPLPQYSAEWELGKPDLVVEMSEAFPVPADGPDVFRNFVVPLGLTEDKWVTAVDFRPSAASVVHHSLLYFDANGVARGIDANDPGPGYAGGMRGLFNDGGDGGPFGKLFGGRAGQAGLPAIPGLPGLKLPPGLPLPPGLAPGGQAAGYPRLASDALGFGSLGAWAAGKHAKHLPKGLAWRLPKGSDLILASHFHPSGKKELEKSKVAFYFSKTVPKERFAEVQLPPGFGQFNRQTIPAGNAEYVLEDRFTLPIAVRGFAVNGHAHYRGRTLTLSVELPDGQTTTLLKIDDWDVNWQEQYDFAKFAELPRGAVLHARVTYDNSENNPRNPVLPPEPVRFGENSLEEMGGMSLMLVAKNPAELPLLEGAMLGHILEEVVAAAR